MHEMKIADFAYFTKNNQEQTLVAETSTTNKPRDIPKQLLQAYRLSKKIQVSKEGKNFSHILFYEEELLIK
jgi:hypothetical protein